MSTHKSDSSDYQHEFLPSEHTARTLVLCFDGTGNEIDKDHTNVSQFFAMLRKDDCQKQMVYYQTGIGTYTNKKFGPIASVMAKTFDSMFGGGIDSHIKDGYEFLMQNYRANDRICIFGFSRGAYTARALAGMIHKVGLLPPSNIRHIEYAYRAFLKTDHAGWAMAREFKDSFSIDVDIEFVGIWDSVGSVGIGMPGLPFSNANTTIKYFRHALSLDERRARFQANVWKSYENTKSSKAGGRFIPSIANKREMELGTGHSSKEQETDVEEVWFSGCHSDVGGGAVHHGIRHSLARISLRWMVRQCFLTGTGIIFTTDSIKKLGFDPNSLYPAVSQRPAPLPVEDLEIRRVPKPRTTLTKLRQGEWPDEPEPKQMSEEEEELYDALTPSYDQLELKRAWWLLEIVPAMRRSVVNDEVVKTFRPNLGGARIVAAQHRFGVKVHRSVKARMQASYEPGRASDEKPAGHPYAPKVHFSVDPTWVD
ncbi:hypothetical protein BDZ94DRAFT_888541 [Collybia nuda]|uniref:T6SS Phospholipase effector Tle1-like catalytic domain-containing protein n=1 Tax=Collybia nuda TaxID=64659 RepID=A0A9P5Y1K6_9AGAR|nr:hypothetical protein BDZ94DRAFT_888541 [Collybia nuda]